MKVWKKLSAVALALVMVMALCVPAFAGETTAEDMTNEGGKIGEFNRNADDNNTPVVKNNKVTIYKEITVFNPSETTVTAPTITYNYAITAGSEEKTITDDSDVKAKTLAGPISGSGTEQKPSITASVEWDTDMTVTAATVANNGSPNRKPITIDFEGVTFPRAGVYRYVITESLPSGVSKEAAGITEGTISETRYLDVYVKDNATTPATKEIYGYVLLVADNDVNDDTAKTEGFVAYGTGNSVQTADQYHTYNLKITKQVVGDAYNMTNTGHQFPFNVTFSNGTVSALVKPILSKSENNATFTQPNASAISSFTDSTLKIGHGGWVKFTGIPMGTSIAITETNDEGNTTYAVTTSGATTNITSAATITNGQSTAANAIAFTAQTAVNSEVDNEVTVTNTMVLISPTGVVLRYAPYMAMLGAGIVALPLSLRKKEELD